VQEAKFVDDDDKDGGGGVSRQLVSDGGAADEEEEEEEGMKRLSKDAARVLAFPLPLPLRPEREVVLDQVLEQLSTTIVVIFLPVVAAAGWPAFCRSLLPPDFSDTSLAGPVADANEIFSSSNSAGPEARRSRKKACLRF